MDSDDYKEGYRAGVKHEDAKLKKLAEDMTTCVMWKGKSEMFELIFNRIKDSRVVDNRVYAILDDIKKDLDIEFLERVSRPRKSFGTNDPQNNK